MGRFQRLSCEDERIRVMEKHYLEFGGEKLEGLFFKSLHRSVRVLETETCENSVLTIYNAERYLCTSFSNSHIPAAKPELRCDGASRAIEPLPRYVATPCALTPTSPSSIFATINTSNLPPFPCTL